MSEFLSIPYLFEEEMESEGIETFLRFCFDELNCSRTPPENKKTNQFGYTTAETNQIQYHCSVGEAIDNIAQATSGTIWLWYDDLNLAIHIQNENVNRPTLPSVSLSINEWYTKPWRNNQPSLIYEFVLELYHYLSPICVYGDTYLDESPLSANGIKTGRLEEIFWVNGFGPEMAEQIGRERLLHAPAWRIDECDDGGIFLWEAPLPLSPEKQQVDAQLRAYFGVNFDSTS